MRFEIEFGDLKNGSPQNFKTLDNTSAIYDYSNPKEETEGAYHVDIEDLGELEDFIREINYEFGNKFKTAVCFDTNRLILV